MVIFKARIGRLFSLKIYDDLFLKNIESFLFNSHSGSTVELLEEVEAVRGQERDVGDDSARGVGGPDDDLHDNE